MSTNYKCGGWLPDPKNKAYIPFDRTKISGVAASSSNDVDLRPFVATIYNQGQTESCTGHGSGSALELKYCEKFGIDKHVALSKMDIYWNGRNLMNPQCTNVDAGANISLVMDALRLYGVCEDSIWPFNPEKINTAPSILSIRQGDLNKITGHFKIDSTGTQLIDDIVLNLKNKNPVVFGMTVGSEFQTYTSTSDPISKLTNPQGGHCTFLCGWINGLFIGCNSWDVNWGCQGFYFIDPNFLVSGVASDFWVMQTDFDTYWQIEK
jgi:hypothetical protein